MVSLLCCGGQSLDVAFAPPAVIGDTSAIHKHEIAGRTAQDDSPQKLRVINLPLLNGANGFDVAVHVKLIAHRRHVRKRQFFHVRIAIPAVIGLFHPHQIGMVAFHPDGPKVPQVLRKRDAPGQRTLISFMDDVGIHASQPIDCLFGPFVSADHKPNPLIAKEKNARSAGANDSTFRGRARFRERARHRCDLFTSHSSPATNNTARITKTTVKARSCR